MSYIVSISPILLLFILMLGLKVSGWKSAVITLISTIILSLFFVPSLNILPTPLTGKPMIGILGYGILEGALKAVFPIFLIILMAIYSYNVVVESGQIETIKRQFSQLTDDKGILVLIMVWGVGGLLEGMAGFGTAVAIPAAILIGLGFRPYFSAIVALLGNTVATGFAALGVPVISLCKEAYGAGSFQEEALSAVSTMTIIQLLPLFFLVPFVILTLTQRKRILWNLGLTLWVGTCSFSAQILCAYFIGAETPAIVGSVVAILSLIAAAKVTGRSKSSDLTLNQSLKAWSVYIIILLLVLISCPLFPTINTFLKTHAVTQIELPIISSTFRFGWFSNTAVLLLIGAVIGGLVQGLTIKTLYVVFCRTLISLKTTFVTLVSLIALAAVMNYTGMISTLAIGLVNITGPLYPLFAPLIGAIGTFVTGSDTSSNILFAKLQVNVAENLGLTANKSFFGVYGNETNWLLAANTTGATGGKMISPQSIAIATASCQMKDSDDALLKSTLPYAIAYVLIGGVMVLLPLL